VNPLVAVALGYLAAGEQLTLEMVLASCLVVASVFLILRDPPPRVRTITDAGRNAARQTPASGRKERPIRAAGAALTGKGPALVR
jgi:hypothetical protein